MRTQIVVHGSVKADGTLELDNKVALPAGRVVVTVHAMIQPAPEDPFWGLMGQIWDGKGRRGRGGMGRWNKRGAPTSKVNRVQSELEI